jgi:hypothetical protein
MTPGIDSGLFLPDKEQSPISPRAELKFKKGVDEQWSELAYYVSWTNSSTQASIISSTMYRKVIEK